MLLDEELGEAEIASELAPVTLQLALIDARQGRTEAAEASFKVRCFPHGGDSKMGCSWG